MSAPSAAFPVVQNPARTCSESRPTKPTRQMPGFYLPASFLSQISPDLLDIASDSLSRLILDQPIGWSGGQKGSGAGTKPMGTS
jgi:hypothetical protein